MLTSADRAALADRAAGRLIDSDTMAQRLGGWQMARLHDVGLRLPVAGRAADTATPLWWSATAVAECERFLRLLAALDGGGDRRCAAALVATMIRLMIEQSGEGRDIVDVPLFASLALRIGMADGAITVLGLRDHGTIR